MGQAIAQAELRAVAESRPRRLMSGLAQAAQVLGKRNLTQTEDDLNPRQQVDLAP